MKFITIYVTHFSREEAEKIVNKLLNQKLIACVNYLPIEVAYHWNGEIANDNEVVSLLKTKTENWEKVKEFIMQNHPYEIPCLMKTEVEANEEYVNWIYDVTE